MLLALTQVFLAADESTDYYDYGFDFQNSTDCDKDDDDCYLFRTAQKAGKQICNMDQSFRKVNAFEQTKPIYHSIISLQMTPDAADQ